MPFSDLFELYPWESGVVLLATGVGLFEFHPAACDSVSDVRFHIVVEVLELVNEILRVVFVAFVWYGLFVVSGIGVAVARVLAHVKVPGDSGLCGSGLILPVTTVLLVVIRGLVVLDGSWELGVAEWLRLGGASDGNWDFLSIWCCRWERRIVCSSCSSLSDLYHFLLVYLPKPGIPDPCGHGSPDLLLVGTVGCTAWTGIGGSGCACSSSTALAVSPSFG